MTQIFYARGRWYEAVNIRPGQIPTCSIGQRVTPKTGDRIVAGLSDKGWRANLEQNHLDTAMVCQAIDGRWSEIVVI